MDSTQPVAPRAASGDCALTVLLFGDGYALDFGLGHYA